MLSKGKYSLAAQDGDKILTKLKKPLEFFAKIS